MNNNLLISNLGGIKNNFKCLTVECYFNQLLNNSLDNLINLQELTFSDYFNQPLNNSLNNLIN